MSKKANRSVLWVFGTMLVSGVAALVASFILTMERLHLAENPGGTLSCDVNVFLNCSSVMSTWQASLFGFPNSYIGLMAYPVVITVAVAALGGAQFNRLFLIAAHFIYFLLGAVFAYWLFFQSLYVIEILCPWCLVVTFTTTLIFATMTNYVLRENIYKFSASKNAKVQSFLDRDYHKLTVLVWLILMVVLVFIKFGDSIFA